MEIMGFELDELRRLIILKDEVKLLVDQRRYDRPRRIMTWLKWRRRAELRRKRDAFTDHKPAS